MMSAKEKWSKMTPQEQAATIASARQKKIADLSAIERVGQRDDMMKETAAQSGALKPSPKRPKRPGRK